MKRNLLFLSTILLTGHAMIVGVKEQAPNNSNAHTDVNSQTTKAPQSANNKIQAKITPNAQDVQYKITKTKSIERILTPGQILNISDFIKMPSGVMYKIITKGSGEKPVQGEVVTVHYTGYLLLDGKKVGLKFDSSLDRGQTFQFKLGSRQVIPGWEISLADMKIGETRIVILPSTQAYGSRATASIPADSTLIFEISLINAA